MNNLKSIIVFGSFLLIVLLTASILMIGNDIEFSHLVNFLSGSLNEGYEYTVLYAIRIPKVLVVIFVGASLAVAGYLMQQLVNNPLADPYLLSTASGASLGVNLTITGLLPVFTSYNFVMPFYGFVFGLMSTLLVVYLSSREKFVNTLLLVITGVSLSSLLTAFTSLLVYYSDSTSKLRSMLFWAMGSFEKAQWEQIPMIVTALLFAIIIVFTLRKHFMLLLMGNSKATMLGGKVKIIQLLLLICSTLLVSISVSICGPIGFVGLIIPHFSRALIGVTNKYIILFNVLLGAIFLLFCELFSQIIVPSIGLPVGVVASFVGLPFFLYLLLNKKYHFGK